MTRPVRRQPIPQIEVRQKAYYGRRLLELGPLPYCEFREITGWPPEICHAVLRQLEETEVADGSNGLWRLRT